MKNFKIALFAYNFPHRKTNDFIKVIYKNHFKISVIIAADFVEIKSPKSVFRFQKYDVKETLMGLAERYMIPIVVAPHNSEKTKNALKQYSINLGVISGARILSQEVILLIKYGILNFHPGLLPYVRGLDSVLWSIDKDFHIGVTAHLISNKIDSGTLVLKKKINVHSVDNLESLYEKNYQLQLQLMPISLNLVFKNTKFNVFSKDGVYNKKMTYTQQLKLVNKIDNYIQKYSTLNEKN